MRIGSDVPGAFPPVTLAGTAKGTNMTMTDTQAVNAIAGILSGHEWTSDELDSIGEVLNNVRPLTVDDGIGTWAPTTDLTMRITYSPDSHETFIECLRWPAEKHYTVALTMSDGRTFDAELRGLIDNPDEQSGVKYVLRVEIDCETYTSTDTKKAPIWSDTEAYLVAVHVY